MKRSRAGTHRWWRLPFGLGKLWPMALWLAVPAALVVLAIGGMAVVVSRHYRTPRIPPRRTPADLGIEFEDIRFDTVGGKRLHGWWIPATAGREAGPLTVILVHGWGRNVDRVLPYLAPLHTAGCDLLAFDARSHGSSDEDGTSNMVKFSEDIRAAVDEALRRGQAGDRVAVVGLSVGGAGAIHAAAHDARIRAVVSVGAFASPADLMRGDLRARRLPRLLVAGVLRYVELNIGARLTEIAPERQIADIDAPVLVVHGEDDVIVPVEHARRLAAAGGGTVRLLLLAGRGHSDCDRDPRFWPAVAETLDLAPGTVSHHQ